MKFQLHTQETAPQESQALLEKSLKGFGMIPNLEFAGQVAERFPPESKLITACLRGGRSLRAAQVLVAEGFTDVVDMRGGYDGELDAAGNVVFPGWARRGLPTTTDS